MTTTSTNDGEFSAVVGSYTISDDIVIAHNVTYDDHVNITGTLTVNLGKTFGEGAASKNLTVSGAVQVNGTLDLDRSSSDGNASFGSLTISNTGIVEAPSHGNLTLTTDATDQFLYETISGATFNNNDGTVTIEGDGKLKPRAGTGNFHNLTINASGNTIDQSIALTCEGDLTITAGTLDTDSSNNYALTVTGDASVTGTLTGNASAISFGSLEIASGGTYNATSGTTTITSNTATGTRSVYNNGGTFTHNKGTLKIDTSAATNYDFDGDDLYNFTVECENGSGALTCDGEASTAVTVLNNLDIKMGILRTNANSFTIHGNVFVRETSLTNKNKFVAQGANQTVKGLITVEDGAFFDMQNQGSGSFGTLTTGGIRVL